MHRSDVSRRRRTLTAVAVLACTALMAAACGDDDDDASASTTTTAAESSAPRGDQSGPGTPEPRPLDERTKVTIGTPVAIEPFAALYLAIAEGEFDKENLDVDVVNLPLPDGLTQISQNRLQLYLAGPAAGAFNAVAAGGDARFIANTHFQSPENEEGLWVNKDFLDADGELDPEKIPGMRVAIGTGGVGSPPAYPINRVLQEKGFSINDVESVTIGGPDMVVALKQGSIDAGFVLSPFWQDPELDDCCQLVTEQPPFAAGIYVMTESFMQDRPEVAQAIMRALMRTNRTYLQGDYHADQDVMSTLAEAFGVTVDALSQTPSLVFDPDLRFEDEVVEPIQEMWIGVGGILSYDEPIPADEIVDTSIIDAILEE